ncbi:MAG: hypothetical protein IPG25_02925 [Proteobacteria bacterium]|nr:hypothetical protein [Pseudomonadota bacterium]
MMMPTVARSAPETRAGFGLQLVAADQSRGGERDIERVLLIVVNRVDAEVARHMTGEHPLEILEHGPENRKRLAGPDAGKQFLNGVPHGWRRTDLHGTGDVVIATSLLHRMYG